MLTHEHHGILDRFSTKQNVLQLLFFHDLNSNHRRDVPLYTSRVIGDFFHDQKTDCASNPYDIPSNSKTLITVRKRSLGKVMFLHVSVIHGCVVLSRGFPLSVGGAILNRGCHL